MAAGFPAMAINALRNKRCGPGGSARRLHHLSSLVRFPSGSGREGISGGETGSTCVVKAMAFARWGTADTGPFVIVANDNYAPVRAAA